MKLNPGSVVCEAGTKGHLASKWEVLHLVQETRYRRTYVARNASEDLHDHEMLLNVCRYDDRLLGNKSYVDNVRRRLLHEAKVLTAPHNVLPQAVDLFFAENPRDAFSFRDAECYARSEPVLVTERYQGTPLDVLVQQRGSLHGSRAIQIALKICDLLEDLHAGRILAFELRPEDLLVDESDHDSVWVLGCASYQKMGRRGAVQLKDLVVPLTDFSFTAPEVEQGKAPLDSRSDIYSFGSLLFYLLTGNKARNFFADKDGERQTIYGSVQRSPELCQLLRRCLSVFPSRRPRSIEEVRVALKQAQDCLKLPVPESITQVTVQKEEEHLVLQWELPGGWSENHGVRVVRWCSSNGPPPDIEAWENVVDEVPSELRSATDTQVVPGATVSYAVMAQVELADGKRYSHPAFASAEIGTVNAAAQFLVGFLWSPGLILWGLGIATGRACRGLWTATRDVIRATPRSNEGLEASDQ